jgi:purine-binding chemotaxis protein CheW
MLDEKDVFDNVYDDDEEDEDTLKDKYLTFCVGNEEYGVSIRHVIEVIGMQKITPVPEMPVHIKGVINLRGQVIPVTDMRSRFKMAEKEYTERTCITVVNVRENSIGLVVDAVSDVIHIPEDRVEPVPDVNKRESNRFIQGMGRVGDDVKIILDVERLLFDEQ